MARKDTLERQRRHAAVNRDIAPYRVRLNAYSGEWVIMREVPFRDWMELDDVELYSWDEVDGS